MENFSDVKVALGEITTRIVTNRKALLNAKQGIGVANADLGSMLTQFGPIVADVVARAAGDANLAGLKAEKDLLVAEFSALKATAQAMVNALA